MTKCGNFFRPEETKGREDSIWFHTSESIRLFACSVYPPWRAKAFGVAFCYKDCFGEPHLRLRSAMARRLDDCSNCVDFKLGLVLEPERYLERGAVFASRQ